MENTRKQLLEKIVFNIGELQACMATSRDGFLARFELSRAQMELLFSIKHSPRSTGELARLFNITPSAVSQMVDQLERRLLVERRTDTNDRRVTLVQLADEAKEQFNSFRQQFIDELSVRFDAVSNGELRTLEKILEKTITSLKKENLWKK
ncbi:MAG: MarR family transcriptional regulator [Candidatus Saccharimonadales bacterium]